MDTLQSKGGFDKKVAAPDKEEPRLRRTVTGKQPDPVKTDLKKDDLREAIITFGKFNPPHAGHGRLIDEMKRLAEDKADVLVYLSKSPGALDYPTKLRFCTEAFGDVVQDTEHLNIFKVLEDIQESYSKITVVVGQDRLAEMGERIPAYFPDVKVVAIDRPEGSESSTALREAAEAGDFKQFAWDLPDGLLEHAEELFETVSLAQRVTPQSARQRSLALARDIVRTRIAGSHGKFYQDLSPAEKIQVDKQMASKQALIQAMANRLLPTTKRVEYKNLQAFYKGSQLKNLAVNEESEDPLTVSLRLRRLQQRKKIIIDEGAE